MLRNNQDAIEKEQTDPKVEALFKDRAKKFRDSKIEKKIAQTQCFEVLANQVADLATKVNIVKAKFFEIWNKRYLETASDLLERVKNVESKLKTFCVDNKLTSIDFKLLEECKKHITGLEDNIGLMSQYCFDNHMKAIATAFEKFNRQVQSQYADLKNNPIPEEFLPTCKLRQSEWGNNQYHKYYEIDNNECVRTINVFKMKNQNWCIELKALKYNADVSHEDLYFSADNNRKLAAALIENEIHERYPGVKYFPDGNSNQGRDFTLVDTLENMLKIWPTILFAIVRVEGDNVFRNTPDIQLIFDSVPRNSKVSELTNHPFWKQGSLNEQQQETTYKYQNRP